LDHIAGFAVVAGGFETGGDNYAVAIFVENESVHRTPPRIASTRSQTIAPIMREPTARTPRAETRDWIRFMGLNGPDNRGAGGMVQRRATEVNRKVKGNFRGMLCGAK